MPSSKKPKTPTKIKISEEEKKHHVKDFLKILDIMFFLYLTFFLLEGVFGFFDEGKPYFECITEEVLRWNLAAKWCKTPQK